MTIKELQKKIKSATKTANSRLRRLKENDLQSHVFTKLEQARRMKSDLVTDSGFISAKYTGYTEKELIAKLKWIKGITEQTETVKQAKTKQRELMEKWNTSKEETNRRIRAGRVFFQALGYQNYLFDSTQVKEAIEEFDKTPTTEELIDRCFEKFGSEIQDDIEGRDALLEWMNRKHIIPDGVNAVENPLTGKIIYID